MEHQVEGVEWLKARSRAILADEQGLGKTAQALWSVSDSNGKILVVCLNTLIPEWEEAIKGLFGNLHGIFRIKNVTRPDKPGFYLINFENVRVKSSQFHKLLEDWDVLIVDESHTVKNRKTLTFKGLKQVMPRVKTAWFMTGTPIMNYVDELWTSLNLLWPREYGSYWKFAQAHANAKPGKYGWEVDKFASDPDALAEELAGKILRRLKSECLDLPPMLYRKIPVETDHFTRILHKSIQEDVLTDLQNGSSLFHAAMVSKLTRLRQVSLNPQLVGADKCGAKWNAILDVLPRLEGKVVVFSTFTEALTMLGEQLPLVSSRLVTGDLDPDYRRASVDDFNSNPDVKFLLVSIRAGGTGLNLQVANTAVFLDRDFNPAINAQAEARIHRIGTTQPCLVIDFVSQGTVEEWVHDVLVEKTEGIDKVLNAIKEKMIR